MGCGDGEEVDVSPLPQLQQVKAAQAKAAAPAVLPGVRLAEVRRLLTDSYTACLKAVEATDVCWDILGAKLVFEHCMKDRDQVRADHDLAASEAATLIRDFSGAARDPLVRLAALESRMCRLATDPEGETLVSYRQKRTGLEDERRGLEAELDILGSGVAP
jgi:hypothetical protein